MKVTRVVCRLVVCLFMCSLEVMVLYDTFVVWFVYCFCSILVPSYLPYPATIFPTSPVGETPTLFVWFWVYTSVKSVRF